MIWCLPHALLAAQNVPMGRALASAIDRLAKRRLSRHLAKIQKEHLITSRHGLLVVQRGRPRTRLITHTPWTTVVGLDL